MCKLANYQSLDDSNVKDRSFLKDVSYFLINRCFYEWIRFCNDEILDPVRL